MFKIGQKVICIKDCAVGTSYDIFKDEILHVKAFTSAGGMVFNEKDNRGVFLITPKGMGIADGYPFHHFAPYEDNFATNVLENIKEKIKEEELVPAF